MKVGDVLRITTAVFNVPGVIDVTAWLNPPKSSNCKAFYVADQKPFDKVMDAIDRTPCQWTLRMVRWRWRRSDSCWSGRRRDLL